MLAVGERVYGPQEDAWKRGKTKNGAAQDHGSESFVISEKV